MVDHQIKNILKIKKILLENPDNGVFSKKILKIKYFFKKIRPIFNLIFLTIFPTSLSKTSEINYEFDS